MPSRHRPKAPPPPPLSDAERFAQAIRDHEEADRRAAQAKVDRKAEAERRKVAAVEHAAKLERAKAAHRRAVDGEKIGGPVDLFHDGVIPSGEMELATWPSIWPCNELIELETGERPPWAAKPESSEPTDVDGDDD